MMTTDAAAATADLDSEWRESRNEVSNVDHSLHDHQYSGDSNGHLKKRKRHHLTGSDLSSNSGGSFVNTELAFLHCAVGREHDAKKLYMHTAICEVCGWFCKKTESLDAHMRTHMGEKSVECDVSISMDTETEFHICDLCGMAFDARPELCKHITDVHTRKAYDDQSIFAVSETDTAAAKSHNIGRRASKMQPLCDVCGWNPSKSNRRRSLKVHMHSKHSTEKPFKCRQCSLTFKLKPNLRRHEMLHANVRGFLCQYCAESFKRKVVLMNHIFRHHTDKLDSSRPVVAKRRGPTRAFGCNICDTSFCFAVRLERHVTTVHGTDNMGSEYKCNFCNEQFEQMVALESHASKEHNIVRPQYQCTECGKLFSLENTLKQHMRFHTDNAFTCNVCGKKFEQKHGLKAHMKTHAGETRTIVSAEFKCNVCEKCFTVKQQLQEHERIHSGAKPFVCNICGRAFRQKAHVVKHRRTHTGDRPYCCSVCNKTYRHSFDLRIHCTRVHNLQLPRRHNRQT